jgi:nucleoside-diphosphate-sugar epimerase
MKILMTGHDGYLGSVMKPMLEEAGHHVIGVDMYYFSDCGSSIMEFPIDIRDFTKLGRFDAVIHLAALSNDPMGEFDKELTFDINYIATAELAKLAKVSGASRFIFSSSCSVYGVSDGIADEESPVCPLSAYSKSKLRAEEYLMTSADEDFSPVILRNSTAFGWSPNFRCDLVVNGMTSAAYTQNRVNIVGDGKQWRPLVHVQDICKAFLLALEAPKKKIHNQIFNIGTRNYQVRAIASAVTELFPSCIVTNSDNRDIDPRSYQVDFSKAKRELGFTPTRSPYDGVEELRNTFESLGITDFSGCVRLAKLKSLMEDGKIDKDLRWTKKG